MENKNKPRQQKNSSIENHGEFVYSRRESQNEASTA